MFFEVKALYLAVENIFSFLEAEKIILAETFALTKDQLKVWLTIQGPVGSG